jgi:UDP-N-acetylmuramoyl-tripeptide--D-alanyl-D-alanine ligase
MKNNLTTKWSAQEVAQAVGSKTTGHWVATGVSKDSRELKPGDLFVALKGPQVDGHDYVVAALEAGAAGVLLERAPAGLEQDPRLIVVQDTLRALNDLAIAARTRTTAKIIAITGSFGKTSIKDATHLLLSALGSVYASERSFNNHWGVPFTLSNMPPDADFGVIEIGMNHPGEIAPLSRIARPQVALITTIREMHMEHLGSLEHIADEKAEIFAGMDSQGIAVLNQDDRMFPRVLAAAQAKNLRVLTFGKHPLATCRLVRYAVEPGGLLIETSIDDMFLSYRLPAMGEHWALNSLAVLGVIKALGLDVARASKEFVRMVLPEGRGVQHRVSVPQGEIIVIDESYNAGPDSMRAALQVLGSMKPLGRGRRVAILGDMLEVGAQAKEIHESLANELMANQVDLIFTCGEQMGHLYASIPERMRGFHGLQPADVIPFVLRCVAPGDIFMIKGSKGQYAHRGRMYAFVEALLGFMEARK